MASDPLSEFNRKTAVRIVDQLMGDVQAGKRLIDQGFFNSLDKLRMVLIMPEPWIRENAHNYKGLFPDEA